jgi:DNA invertase Pin-like site-specific DNA recombinase
MMHDAKKHRFDIILVKSLSRFGRDTLEALSTIKSLKKMNVALLSEVEQINTLEVNDTVLSILLAAAQEESASKSENIKFGIHQRMRSGKAVLNHTRFLGYTKDETGKLVVVPKEAEIVRKIFSLYLDGNRVRKIKRYLEENGIKTVTGKTKWSTSTIDRILSNEKYMGNLLLQKIYTPDFLTGKQKKNCGEQSMFLVENAHEAIVSKEIFEEVQRRKNRTCQ